MSSNEDKKDSRSEPVQSSNNDRYRAYRRSEVDRRSVSPQPTIRSVVVPAENGPFKDGKLIKPLFRPHRFRALQFNCELCNVQCSTERGEEVFDMHLRGQKHLKKQKRKEELEKAGLMDKIQESETYCKMCSVELTSKTHMLLHLSGRRHKQNLMKELSAKNEPIAKTTAEVEEFEKKQADEEEQLIKKAGITDFEKYDIPKERKAAALAEGARNEYYCSVCTKFFSGKTQLAMHLLSVKHKEKEFPQSRLKRAAAARGGRGRGCYRDDMNSMSARFNFMYPCGMYNGSYMPGSYPIPGGLFRPPMTPIGYGFPPMGMPYYPARPSMPLVTRGIPPYRPLQRPLMSMGVRAPGSYGSPGTDFDTHCPAQSAYQSRIDYRHSSPYPSPSAPSQWNMSGGGYGDGASLSSAQNAYWRDGMAPQRPLVGAMRGNSQFNNRYYSDYDSHTDNGFGEIP